MATQWKAGGFTLWRNCLGRLVFVSGLILIAFFPLVSPAEEYIAPDSLTAKNNARIRTEDAAARKITEQLTAQLGDIWPEGFRFKPQQHPQIWGLLKATVHAQGCQQVGNSFMARSFWDEDHFYAQLQAVASQRLHNYQPLALKPGQLESLFIPLKDTVLQKELHMALQNGFDQLEEQMSSCRLIVPPEQAILPGEHPALPIQLSMPNGWPLGQKMQVCLIRENQPDSLWQVQLSPVGRTEIKLPPPSRSDRLNFCIIAPAISRGLCQSEWLDGFWKAHPITTTCTRTSHHPQKLRWLGQGDIPARVAAYFTQQGYIFDPGEAEYTLALSYDEESAPSKVKGWFWQGRAVLTLKNRGVTEQSWASEREKSFSLTDLPSAGLKGRKSTLEKLCQKLK